MNLIKRKRLTGLRRIKNAEGKKISVYFGTNDIRDLAENASVVHCVRVYEDVAYDDAVCGHRHRSRNAAHTCAHALSRGWRAGAEGKSWVEIRPHPGVQS